MIIAQQIATGRIGKIRVIFETPANYHGAARTLMIVRPRETACKERMREETMHQPRRRNHPFLIWAVTGIVIFISAQVFGQAGEPALVITSPSFDVGAVWEGDTISHAFEVKNEGKAELKILEVRPG
jgi:hypothetical protein